MKVIVLLSFAFIGGGILLAHQRTREGPYDIIVRDDKEPLAASFQTKTGSYSVQSCGEYGFGSGGNARIETLGCTTLITFNFKWQGDKNYSFHPRHKCDDIVTINTGDVIHGSFTVDTCAKTAVGTIRDATQDIELVMLRDSDTTDSKDVCDEPPPCR